MGCCASTPATVSALSRLGACCVESAQHRLGRPLHWLRHAVTVPHTCEGPSHSLSIRQRRGGRGLYVRVEMVVRASVVSGRTSSGLAVVEWMTQGRAGGGTGGWALWYEATELRTT
jgi:hypothetical protein